MGYHSKCGVCEKDRYHTILCTKLIKFVCDSCSKLCDCGSCLKERAVKTSDNLFDTDYKSHVFCPYCGEENQDEYETDFWSDAHNGDEFDIECQHCEKEFVVDPHVKVSFSTKVKEEE